jgi:hypothetical protein
VEVEDEEELLAFDCAGRRGEKIEADAGAAAAAAGRDDCTLSLSRAGGGRAVDDAEDGVEEDLTLLLLPLTAFSSCKACSEVSASSSVTCEE